MERDDRWDEIWSERSRFGSGKLTRIFTRDIIYRTVSGILRRELRDPRKKTVLEIGSGSGLVSLNLARKGAETFLLDISPEAVRLSKAAFRQGHLPEITVQASALQLPFRDDFFDITWNAGVIEHFMEGDQVRFLREMLRVTKPAGKAIVIAPSSRARIYLCAKRHADRRNEWQPGYEAPVSSLRDLAARVPARLVYEYRTGLFAELHFLKYYFARPRWLKRAWCGLVEMASLVLFPLNKVPGYLLVSVFEKAD